MRLCPRNLYDEGVAELDPDQAREYHQVLPYIYSLQVQKESEYKKED